MFTQFHKKFWFKATACYLTLSMVVQLVAPSTVFALTSGPSQPEVASFEPFGTSQMVDLFSGDFNYNIDLLTVPGPDGGYPINLSYHAGIGVEQEASWVGLGWNINPGVINRQMRGLPDDFKGDEVKKEIYMKPARTIAVGIGNIPVNAEAFGFDVEKVGVDGSYQIYYNSYRGMGNKIGASFSSLKGDEFQSGFVSSLSLSYDSQSGLGVSPSLSYATTVKDKGFGFDLGLDFNSRQGLQTISLMANRKHFDKKGETTHDSRDSDGNGETVTKSYGGIVSGHGSGVSFAAGSSVPPLDFPRTGRDFDVTLKGGGVLVGLTGDADLELSYSTNSILNNINTYPGYGYLYAHDRSGDNSMADFNREKDVPMTKTSKMLPIPIATNDIYNATGQGVGGMFRPYRNDVGILSDQAIHSEKQGIGAGVDFDSNGSENKGGVNPTKFGSYSYSGTWTDGRADAINGYDFQSKADVTEDEYEPVYFKASGEQTADILPNNAVYNDYPQRFELAKTMQGFPLSFKPELRKYLIDNNEDKTVLTDTYKPDRTKRVQNFHYLTREECDNAGRIVKFSEDGAAIGNYNYGTHEPHHMGEVTVLNPDGKRYVYGLPAYSLTQQDAMFSVDQPSNDYDKLVSYTDEDSEDNDKGDDNLFSKTTIPKYAHSFMLTAIYSPDYVDVDNNGPSEDDFGTYTQFVYDRIYKEGENDSYKWRVPLDQDKANVSRGSFSNSKDDKASYSYGEKEIYYVKEVRTKTHTAVFTTVDRTDGKGVTGKDGGVNASMKLKELQKIELFDNENYPSGTPIKTVHFEYNNSLCDGIPNGTTGKSTLKKVYFEYQGHKSAATVSPYLFEYNEDDDQPTPNPYDYDNGFSDRWGNYQADDPSTFPHIANHENPYVNQSENFDGNSTYGDQDDIDARNDAASAWNLTKITLPSGGEIEVEYEADDYAYVENKRAMQMARVVAVGDTPGVGDEPDLATLNSFQEHNIKKNDLYIYFELENTIEEDLSGNDDLDVLAEYLKDIEEMYYKVYTRLKKNPNENDEIAYDYVEGYAELDIDIDNYTGFGFHEDSKSGSNYTHAYVKVKQVNVSDNGSGSGVTHPFRKAGWQYLRLRRPDLFNQPTLTGKPANPLAIVGPIVTAMSILKEASNLLVGYYKTAQLSGYCNKLLLGDYTSGAKMKPSYLRLNTPDYKKYGGGHRVARISIHDNWSGQGATDSKSFSYAQEYDYTLEDGKSSGVASYEPLVGGEEIPHHMPIVYSTDKLFVKDKALYVEKPFGESYYPSPSVGYSRVVVTNDYGTGTQPADANAGGFTEHQFYTAKDYPVVVDQTKLDLVKFNPPAIPIPFIGSLSYNNRGYSQGFSIELNNMHGKPKSEATYQFGAVPGDDDPVSKTEYHYLTQGDYNAGKVNRLESGVEVLLEHGDKAHREIGKQVDFFVDLRENNITSESVTYFPNLSQILIALIPTILPYTSTSEGYFRSAATTKVINKTGILTKTVNYTEGAKVATENLLYDAETGEPLLTRVTNDFEEPVYTYKYAAHWDHDGMEGAYQNIGGEDASLLEPGDEVVASNGTAIRGTSGWEGTAPSAGWKISRSGYRNMQQTKQGTIVSLSNPSTGTLVDLFNAYNSRDVKELDPSDTFTHYYCENGELTSEDVIVEIDAVPNTDRLNFSNTGNVCGYISFLPAGTIDLTAIPNFEHYVLTYDGTNVYAKLFNNVLVGSWTWYNPQEPCWGPCIPNDVLHAEAVEFLDDWSSTYDYSDALAPSAVITNVGSNPYTYGAKGIWRAEKNYLYQIDRKQTNDINADFGTHINVDGEYEVFYEYDWTASQSTNEANGWRLQNTITKYSPYGFELENADVLDINSSALYGYTQSAVTAVGNNTSYYELAFDCFEDYDGNDYEADDIAHGHIEFTVSAGNPSISSAAAHTGKKSFKLNSGTSTSYQTTVATLVEGMFEPIQNEDYYISVWVKTDGSASLKTYWDDGGGETLKEIFSTSNSVSLIEGWQKLEGKFTAPSNGDILRIELNATGANAYFDDIRIQPFKSTMKSFVYDVETLWLKAELDNRNYATFYSYDENGKLVHVKKETKKGIITISTNRSNTNQHDLQ